MLSSYMDHVLSVAGVNAIGAWAVGIAIRSGQLSVGHAALAGIGGYSAGLLTRGGDNFVVALLVGVVVAAAVGAVLSVLTLRLDHLFLALGTLVFGEMAAIVATDTSTLGGAAGLASIPFTTTVPLVGGVLLAIVLFELAVVRGSRAEIQVQLLAHNPRLVELAGTSAKRLRVTFFTLSAAGAGLAGVFHAHLFGVVQPGDLRFAESLDLVVYAVVGGVHSGFGPIVGAVLLTFAEEFVSIPGITRPVIYGAILLGVLLVRDRGLIPRWRLRITATGSGRRGGSTGGSIDDDDMAASRSVEAPGG